MSDGVLFDIEREGLRVVVTGQVGLDKGAFLEEVVELAKSRGKEVKLCNVGQMMYREAPDVVAGKILDLPISRLNAIRRAVFRDILTIAEECENIIVNTHATFRWKQGLFPAFDHDLMERLRPNLFITLVDNVDAVHVRLVEGHDIDHSLKDLLVWREEEILATEVLATIIRGPRSFFVLARGNSFQNVETCYRLIFEQSRFKKVYASYPMTHIMDLSDIRDEIDRFRRVLCDHFICFDPGDLEEKKLHLLAMRAAEEGRRYVIVNVLGKEVQFDVDQIFNIVGDIHGQIYARDFKFIEQSDMTISYIPATADGKPLISSGVERELQHTYESGREGYVIWRASREPSPFVTETATKVFNSLDEAMEYFKSVGYIKAYQKQL